MSGNDTLLGSLQLVAFDLDDTLAASKSRIHPVMAQLLIDLLRHVRVCIISGGRFEQFQTQVLADISELSDAVAGNSKASVDRLHIMPTCGTQYYEWDGAKWHQVYAEELSNVEKSKVMSVLEEGAKSLDLWEANTFGPILEDRGSQVTFSALGQFAPVDLKAAWDPDGSKKELLRSFAESRLPNLEVRSGGSTSVDVTRKGVDKAYGMHKLMDRLGLQKQDLLFVGDRLDFGGNDYPVKAMGIRCVAIENWADTAVFVRGLVGTLELERGRL